MNCFGTPPNFHALNFPSDVRNLPSHAHSASDPVLRRKYVRLVESVRHKGAEVLIFSSMHESGQRECSNCGAPYLNSDFISDCVVTTDQRRCRAEPADRCGGYIDVPPGRRGCRSGGTGRETGTAKSRRRRRSSRNRLTISTCTLIRCKISTEAPRPIIVCVTCNISAEEGIVLSYWNSRRSL